MDVARYGAFAINGETLGAGERSNWMLPSASMRS